MNRFSRKQLFQFNVAVLCASTVFLLLSLHVNYESSDFLSRLMLFQAKIAFIASLATGIITSAIQRSFWAGGATLAGIFYGAMISGTFGFAIGLSVTTLVERMNAKPTDPDLINPGPTLGIELDIRAIFVGLLVWLIIGGVGAILGGRCCFNWWRKFDRQQK